jgi:hypothetical protein
MPKIIEVKDTGRQYKDKPIYDVMDSDGRHYAVFFVDPTGWKGREVAEFEVTSRSDNRDPSITVYSLKEKKTGGFQGGKGGFQRQPHDNRTMILSYSKDMTIAFIEKGWIADPTKAQLWVKDMYDFLSGIIEEKK